MGPGAIRHWLTALVAFVLAVGVPAVQGVSASRATGPASNGKIAFMSTRDGNPEIYTVNPDGSGLARLTNSDAGDITPAWSPDGRRIAFGCGIGPETDGGFRTVGPSDLCLMDADGSGLVRLTDDLVPDGEPTWSPDGSRIAFWRDWDIYTMKPDGTDVRRLTRNALASEPAWSPDGTKIAFNSSRDHGNHEIYVMHADGTGAVDLTNDLARDDSHPAWSPDGKRIAYNSERSAGGEVAVWLMKADGSGKLRLPPAPGNDAEPAWSPDGTKIVFTRYRDTLTDIFIRNVDGTDAVAVTNLPGFEQHPVWQPLRTVAPASSWTATISGAGMSGLVSLTVPTAGRATAAFSLDRMKTGIQVTARIVAGVGCGTTAAVITKPPGYTTTSGGTWRQRWVFGGSDLARLRSTIRSATPLWFDLSAGGSRICARFVTKTAEASPTQRSVALNTPATGASIVQNDPTTGCAPNATHGSGFVVTFAWTASSVAGLGEYKLVVQHSGSFHPALDVRVARRTFTWTSCDTFVVDPNLANWHWQVTALNKDKQVIAVSEQRPIRFLPCRLADGKTACSSPG